MVADVVSIAYATAITLGGVAGYLKAGSFASLGAGLLFGGVLGYGAYQTSLNPHNYTLLLVTSSILTGVMGYRFYNSGKIMPAGVVTLLSLAMVLRFGARHVGLVSV